MKLCLATFESRNFTFDGVGTSTEEAVGVLIQGLRQHAKEYGLPPEWWYNEEMRREFERGCPVAHIEDPNDLAADGVVLFRIFERGEAYRDREVMPAMGT